MRLTRNDSLNDSRNDSRAIPVGKGMEGNGREWISLLHSSYLTGGDQHLWITSCRDAAALLAAGCKDLIRGGVR